MNRLDKATVLVSTGNAMAADTAIHMLMLGGSAVDAAIAADAVMGVVEPMATGVGGDVLAMIYEPGKDVVSYNGTGRAPAGLTEDKVGALPNARIPQRHALAVTTPGAVAGWSDLHQRYGRLDWKRLFQPAIKYACDGFAVGAVAANEWRLFNDVLRNDPVCGQLYRVDRPPSPGETVVNTALGRSLTAIADKGSEFFYKGWIPGAAAEAVQSLGGVLAEVDFVEHRGNFDVPLAAAFYDATVYQCPPNTHGRAVLDALNGVARFNGDPKSPKTWIDMVQNAAQAMDAASETICDPAGNTVCTTIVDRQGLAINLMSSIYKRFGTGIAVPGAGFCLQNRAFGFSALGHPNEPGPRKRPYHTVIPGITTLGQQFYMALGVVGGLMQPQGQIQILTRVLAWGQDLQAAVNAPRWRLEEGSHLALERGWPDSVSRALRNAGFQAPEKGVGELGGRSDFGGASAIMHAGDGARIGASDPRKDGAWRSN